MYVAVVMNCAMSSSSSSSASLLSSARIALAALKGLVTPPGEMVDGGDTDRSTLDSDGGVDRGPVSDTPVRGGVVHTPARASASPPFPIEKLGAMSFDDAGERRCDTCPFTFFEADFTGSEFTCSELLAVVAVLVLGSARFADAFALLVDGACPPLVCRHGYDSAEVAFRELEARAVSPPGAVASLS